MVFKMQSHSTRSRENGWRVSKRSFPHSSPTRLSIPTLDQSRKPEILSVYETVWWIHTLSIRETTSQPALTYSSLTYRLVRECQAGGSLYFRLSLCPWLHFLTSTKVKFYTYDVEECEDIAHELGVSQMPTFSIFKDGDIQEGVTGARATEVRRAIEGCL
jgi:hypothetical protein